MLLVVNITIVAVLFILERGWGFRYESAKSIRYDRIELVTPEKYMAMLDDLRKRIGLPINRVEVGSIDFLNDTANITIYYDEPPVSGLMSSVHEVDADGSSIVDGDTNL